MKMQFSSQRTENIYKNLMKQVTKVAKHNRQGSFKTKEKYLESASRICKHVAEHYGTQKFSNIQDKHIESYIEEMREKNLAPSYIKSELSAIRFFHDKCEGRYQISDNEKFGLERRQIGKVDRAWNDKELERFLEVTRGLGRERDCAAVTLGREMGLRIHEVLRISRSDAENALRNDFLHVKGKGGKERDVPLTSESRAILGHFKDNVERGQKLFVESGEKTHLIIKNIQNHLSRSREKWQDPERTERGEPNRTFHGVRHAYARERYEYFVNRGMNEYEARKSVSQLLGHERDEVTRIYLAK